MDVGATLKVLGAGPLWRLAGVTRAGDLLVESFEQGDEQTRALSGMFLVKSGDRTVDLLAARADDGTLEPETVGLIADVGTERARSALQRLASTPGPISDVASARLDLLGGS